VAIGSADQVIYHAAPREPAAWPHQIGLIPSRAQSFQLRAEAERLRATVESGGTAVLGQVLTGMGGVGKTQLAGDYARTAWQEGNLDVLVWVTASTRSAVVTGYAQAGVELCLADPDDPERAAQTLLAWLTPKAGARLCRWLIVLDDVADPDDLRGLWPPPSPYGRTVVTTRRRDAALTGESRRRIEVGLFTEAEAVAYLTTSLAAHGRHEPAGHLTALASDLGHLPLALSQAAAYLIDSSEDVAAYRSLLADRATTLIDTTPDQLPDEQAIPLAAAWSLSIDRADLLRPVGLARPMLQLASMLDPNGIPQTVLTSRPALAYLTWQQTAARTVASSTMATAVTAQDAVGALRALHRLSLIDHISGTPHQSVRVHQLIQRAICDPLAPSQRDQVAGTAADALHAAWPQLERDPALAQALRSNATVLAGQAGDDALYRPYVHRLLYRAGTSLGESGQAAAARDHFQHVAATANHHLGANHRDTLRARYELALWRGEAGDAAGALAAFEELLSKYLLTEGPRSHWALAVRHRIAQWWGRSGDAAADGQRPLAALEELLSYQLTFMRADNPYVLAVRHNIAERRGRSGDAAGALAAFEELLPDQTRMEGADDPNTLIVRHHIAEWRGKSGDAAGALAAIEELLPDQTRVWGAEHRSTLNIRHSLAMWTGEAGDAAGAVAAFEELLPDQTRVLGAEHPDTLTTRQDLDRWREAVGDA
jgi:hypothetical protein